MEKYWQPRVFSDPLETPLVMEDVCFIGEKLKIVIFLPNLS